MTTTARTQPLRGARAREAVLAAAAELFSASGFRRASIEDLARTAGVSRPTVYAHFESKEDVFRELVRALHEEHLAGMEAAIDAGGALEDRLYRSLAARFGHFVELMSSSPHAQELLDENSKVCGDITRESRRRSLFLLRRLLEEAEAGGELDLARSGLSIPIAAAVIYDCADGAKEDDGSTTLPAYRRRLRQVVRALLGGLAADPHR